MHWTPRLLFYSHDGVGLGHARRNLAIAAAVKELEPRASILLACGTAHVERSKAASSVDFLKLPELKKLTNQTYASRRLGVPEMDILELRSSLLQTAVRAFRPHVMLVDKHPLGVCEELAPALETLRAIGGRAILGLRDILDEAEVVEKEWHHEGIRERIPQHYERVLVYGQREIYDAVTQYRFPPALAERTRFCGYVVGREAPEPAAVRRQPQPMERLDYPCVLATAGGGEDGFFLLKQFVEASEGAPWSGVVIAGPLMSPTQREVLRRLAARAGVWFEEAVGDLPTMLTHADAVVSMGGYNTLMEALVKAIPTVCVPRTFPRSEQLIRALAFEQIGLLQVIRPEILNPEILRQKIGSALATRRRALRHHVKAALDLRGAAVAAAQLLGLEPISNERRRLAEVLPG